jgi:hypothetical protein
VAALAHFTAERRHAFVPEGFLHSFRPELLTRLPHLADYPPERANRKFAQLTLRRFVA